MKKTIQINASAPRSKWDANVWHDLVGIIIEAELRTSERIYAVTVGTLCKALKAQGKRFALAFFQNGTYKSEWELKFPIEICSDTAPAPQQQPAVARKMELHSTGLTAVPA